MERRSPTGIARERETRTNNAAPRQSHGCEPTHRQPRRITWGALSAGLRPASRGSAKPAPTTPPPANLTAANPRIANRAESRGAWSAGQFSRWGPPTGIARERETRTACAPPISRLRTHASPRQNHGDGGAPVSDRHRAGARNPHRRPAPRQSHGCEPTHRQPRRITGTAGAPASSPGGGLRPASRGSAKPAPTTPRLTALGAHPGSTTGC